MRQLDYIAHHGVLGQKWGIRRYQNPDETLTAAGQRRARNKYNYKESDRYKRANGRSRRLQEAEHAELVRRYGRIGANRIQYDTRVAGKSKKEIDSVKRKEAAKNISKGVAFAAGTSLAISGINRFKNYVDTGSRIVEAYGKSKGLSTVEKRGLNINIKQTLRTAQLGRAYYDTHGLNGSRGIVRAAKMVDNFQRRHGYT